MTTTTNPPRVPARMARAAGVARRAALLLMLSGAGTVPVAQAQEGASEPPASAASAAGDDPAQYVKFSQDFAGLCVSRNGVEILVSNAHPTRTVRVWFDRYHMGTGTGDRSRSDLAPGAEPEALGCSRTFDGPQEWRLVRAVFVD